MLTSEEKERFLRVVDVQAHNAHVLHPSWPKDAVHASAILNEEAGKLTQASIDYHYNHYDQQDAMARMAEMTARVAAMAMRLWENLDKYEPLED